jgi:RNA polymerase sigma factor (sigma-70 family)
MHTGPTDTEIIAQVASGSSQAYALLVDRYRNFVFTIVLRYISSREDAEEVAQDVFVKAYKSLADFRGQSKFSTWLYTVATTTCLSFLRKKKQVVHSLEDERVFDPEAPVPGGFRADLVEQKSRISMVQEAIGLLAPDDAKVITLFYQLEQNLEEIAKILGKETNAVKVQLHRARSRLKEKIVQQFGNEVKDIY